MESPAAKYARMQEPCDVEIASELFGPKKGFAVAISKDSRKLTMYVIHDYEQNFNIIILIFLYKIMQE